jgi:hypothetical protein
MSAFSDFLECFSQSIFMCCSIFCVAYHLFLKKWLTLPEIINFLTDYKL